MDDDGEGKLTYQRGQVVSGIIKTCSGEGEEIMFVLEEQQQP